MSFKKSVDEVLGHGVCKRGLGGLKAADAAHVTVATPRALLGSADVDEARTAADPNGSRWDYLIGLRRGSQHHACWVEVHPASGCNNVTEIERKLDWLKAFLHEAPALAAYPRDVVWIASGRSSFNARSPQIKALASQGCRFAGGHLKL